MFDFLFRRRGGAAAPAPSATSADRSAPTPSEVAAAAAAERKQAALAAAEALSGDETQAADFILNCEFADARAIAARHLQSRPALERVLAPMRNSDRRVARLCQQRLDALAARERTAQQAAACMAQAGQLLAETHLLPNQVAELDHAWSALTPDEAEQADYRPLRAALEARLLAQAALQRSALDTLARLRQLQDSMNGATPPPPADLGRALDILEGAMANHLTAPEAASLPRHFGADFEQLRDALRAAWAQASQRAEQLEAALQARRDALAAWEAAVPPPPAAQLHVAWQALPAADAVDDDLQQRFQALLAAAGPESASAAAPAETSAIPAPDREALRQQARTLLAALETALEQGALQQAQDSDAQLRALAAVPELLPAPRLARARAELARLRDWARWSGRLSRGELLKMAQDLPEQALPPPELARRIGALRAQWKALDVSAGAAARDDWLQFDAACSTAYAPAAEYFAAQAEQRQANLAQAEALLAPLEEYAAQLRSDPEAADWKAIAALCTRSQQAWRRLGPVERKEKKRLDRAFEAALQALRAPLAQRQAAAADEREPLIAAVLALDPAARDAPEALAALQRRWQEMAQAQPLERRTEQQLWQRFRAACDGVFAQRRSVAADADRQRREHLRQKEALCDALEAVRGQPAAAVRAEIARQQAAWSAIGAVPRAQERQIEARRQAALAALSAQLDEERHAVASAAIDALGARLTLCQQIERQLADGAAGIDADEAQARWQTLAATGPALADWQAALQARFDAAITALRDADADYAARLRDSHAPLADHVLRLEILSGIDSPPHQSRQRLQLQVDVLAAHLKSGSAAAGDALAAEWRALCALPAPADAETRERITRLLAAYRPKLAGRK